MAYFPDRLISDAGVYAGEYYTRLAEAAATIDPKAVSAAAELILRTTQAGRRIYACGNGGSAAIANHLVCDCMKGIRSNTGLRPKVHSLSSNVEILTAIVNDIGSDDMFAFQLESLGEPGDLLISISSSGASPNIVKTLELARAMGIQTIAMSGFAGNPSRQLADVSLHVDCENYGIVEDLHQSLMHILAQYTRHANLDSNVELGSIKF